MFLFLLTLEVSLIFFELFVVDFYIDKLLLFKMKSTNLLPPEQSHLAAWSWSIILYPGISWLLRHCNRAVRAYSNSTNQFRFVVFKYFVSLRVQILFIIAVCSVRPVYMCCHIVLNENELTFKYLNLKFLKPVWF